jgi:hypothetical protein
MQRVTSDVDQAPEIIKFLSGCTTLPMEMYDMSGKLLGQVATDPSSFDSDALDGVLLELASIVSPKVVDCLCPLDGSQTVVRTLVDFLCTCFHAVVEEEAQLRFQVVYRMVDVSGEYIWDTYACGSGSSLDGSGFASLTLTVSEQKVVFVSEAVFHKCTSVFTYVRQDVSSTVAELHMTLAEICSGRDAEGHRSKLQIGQGIVAQVNITHGVCESLKAPELWHGTFCAKKLHPHLMEIKGDYLRQERVARLADYQRRLPPQPCSLICTRKCNNECGKTWPHTAHVCEQCSPCREECSVPSCCGYCGRRKLNHRHHRCHFHRDLR